MPGIESRPGGPDSPRGMKLAGGRDVRSANEPAPVAPDPLTFDPRNKFYPQTLLTAEDLRVPLPPRRSRFGPIALKVVAVLGLALGAGAAYMYIQRAPATQASPEATPATPREVRPSPTTTGTIAAKSAPAPRPAAPATSTPSASPPAAAARPSVTHLKPPGAPVAVGAEAARAAAPEKRVVPAKAAEAARSEPPPRSTPQDPRTSDCTEAGKALGLCIPR